MNTRLYLAAYDIAHPKRLQQALRILRDYATGGQKSVFECFLTPAEKDELMERMKEVIIIDEDRFFLVPLQARAKTWTLGLGTPPSDPPFYYFD